MQAALRSLLDVLHALEEVRDLGATKEVSDEALSRALRNIVFGEGSHVLDGGHSLWDVTELCLSDHDGNAGLLTTRPYVALALVEQQLATLGAETSDPRS